MAKAALMLLSPSACSDLFKGPYSHRSVHIPHTFSTNFLDNTKTELIKAPHNISRAGPAPVNGLGTKGWGPVAYLLDILLAIKDA